MRVINGIGRRLRRWGWRRGLSGDAILERARRSTHLSHLGDESFREPFRILVDSLENDARLTPSGRMIARGTLVHMVENRLRIEQLVREHPEIEAQPVSRPLFVVGMPRTGTTLLYNLLAQDPEARPLRSWETFFPAPLREGAPPAKDPRVRQTRWLVRSLGWVAPQLQEVHPVDPEGYEECTWLLANTFRSPSFGLMGDVRTYLDWLWDRNREERLEAYGEYRRQLQVLQWQQGGGHWVLKSPVHLQALDALLEVFPDASVVQTHRDPEKVIPSACSLFAVLRGIYSDEVRLESLGEEMTERLARTLERAALARAAHPERILDVPYRDLVEDKLGTVRKIYRHFGYDYGDSMDARLREWLDRDRHAAGGHRYELAQFGLNADRLESSFRDYRRQFLR